MAAKLTRLTHKIAIQLHLVAESSTICSSRSRRPVRKLLVTPSYLHSPYTNSWRGAQLQHRDNYATSGGNRSSIPEEMVHQIQVFALSYIVHDEDDFTEDMAMRSALFKSRATCKHCSGP